MLAIVDYGVGNLYSLASSLKCIGAEHVIAARPEQLRSASHIILPGVGAFADAARKLRQSGMRDALLEEVRSGKPLLGICLGCQILLDRSEENDTATLGILPGVCRRFQPEWQDGGQPIRIPHMGWNSLRMKQESPLFKGIAPDAQFYFVHSFYTAPAPELVIASCEYGREFTAAYGRPGLWAVQFHPEKSGRPGLRLLQNFYECCQEAAHV